jgi:hypothetical protein
LVRIHHSAGCYCAWRARPGADRAESALNIELASPTW